MDVVEKQKILGPNGNQTRPLRTQSLYQLRYPSSPLTLCRSGKRTAQETAFATIPLLLRVYPLPRESVHSVHSTGIRKMETCA
jgi:hypothetical protein